MSKKSKRYCCIPECTRARDDSSVSFFAVPSGKKSRGFETAKYREDTIKFLYSIRSPHNKGFKQKIESHNAYICSKHFTESDIVKGKCSPPIDAYSH